MMIEKINHETHGEMVGLGFGRMGGGHDAVGLHLNPDDRE